MEKDRRSRAQWWADKVTEFSGSWTFIFWFVGICIIWILINLKPSEFQFDAYPFLFLNWTLTVVSTLQNPIILLSQNRQNDMDRGNVNEILKRLEDLQKSVDELK